MAQTGALWPGHFGEMIWLSVLHQNFRSKPMSETTSELAEKCGRLLRFALMPRLLPSGDPEYLALVREFLSNPGFQDITSALAKGLGLRVLSASTQSGLVIGTT